MSTRPADLWRSLEPRAQLTIVVSALVVVATLFFLFQLGSRPSWATVATGLTPSEAGDVGKALDQAGIPYELQHGGATVVVQKADVEEARVAMAESGVPTGGHVGWEIFDSKSIGATDFQQRVDYQRALEGEIARTIEGVDGVRSVEVRLVLPEKTLFLDEGSQPSAAVVLHGSAVDSGAVTGIARLVASSVEGLRPEDVAITDDTGTLLWPTGLAGGAGALAKLEAEQRYSMQVAAQINAMLTSTLGVGKGQARVNASLDLDQRTVENVTYGKEGVPITQQEESETLDSKGTAPQGPAGVAGNVPGYTGGGAGGTSKYSKTTGNTEYGVDKRVESTTVVPGTVEKLSVALVLDKDVPDAQVNALEQAVAAVAGIDPKRGDTLSVAKVDFAEPEETTPAGPSASPIAAAGGPMGLAKWAVLGVGTLLFLFIVRSGLKRRESESVVGAEPTWLREITEVRPLAELEAPPPEPRAVAQPRTRRTEVGEQLDEIVRRQPDQVAAQVSQWMRE